MFGDFPRALHERFESNSTNCYFAFAVITHIPILATRGTTQRLWRSNTIKAAPRTENLGFTVKQTE